MGRQDLTLMLQGFLPSKVISGQSSSAMEGHLILWLLLDGKPGHENQSLGLSEALERRVACQIHRISLGRGRGWMQRMRCAAKAAGDLPAPDLIIGTGHATHLPLLWLARQHRAKSIVLMRPSLPLSWFDLCIAPEHDFPAGCRRPNVILTRGALNRITPTSGKRSGKLILIGGPSKTHDWNDKALLEMLPPITASGGWELTDSRRTPEGFLSQLREKLPGIDAISHTQTPPDWVPEKLRHASEVWVTEDSVSMIYEALTSGAKVGLLPLPRRVMDSRVLRGIEGLLVDGYLTPFSNWTDNSRLMPPPQPLQEADRCAEMICSKWIGGDS